MIGRMLLAWKTVGKTFGSWIAPVFTAVLFTCLRLMVGLGRMLDWLFFPRMWKQKVVSPIVIVGNPRTGTTFLQRWLTDHEVGTGSRLWQMLYPTLLFQKVLKPFVPFLEKVSPARHHSTEAHETSLDSVETDDVAVLFRYFDGFFLYGFFLAFAEEEYRDLFEPSVRDTSKRDFDWLESVWRRNLVSSRSHRNVAKLFSLGPRVTPFVQRFPDAKILYMVRDPVSVIPSAMSLVTGVLDKRFGFWALPEEVRNRYLRRLYTALVELMRRFHDDWVSGKLSKEHVMIVRYDRMMGDFEGLMAELLAFIGHEVTPELQAEIDSRGEKQRAYKSKHAYDLDKFGLNAEEIKRDCGFVYETFLSEPVTTG